MKLEKKEKVVAELKKQLLNNKGLWLTDFSGLEATTVTKLRKLLKENNISYKVVKNTMLELAFKGTQYEELNKYIKGPVGICFGEDIVKGSNVLVTFQKESEKFSIKEAWLDGQIYESKRVEQISKLPSREVLVGQVLNIVVTPSTKLVNVLNGILINLVSVLDEIKKSAKSEPADGGQATATTEQPAAPQAS